MVLELCGGGDLNGIIQQRRDKVRKSRHIHTYIYTVYTAPYNIRMVSIVSSYSHSTAQTSFFDERQIWFIFLQLCEGLKHLHEHGIIHRDLKPLNVFCSSNGRTFKIGDLGVSRQVLPPVD